ncbi:MAG: hypothetical protein AAFQ94_06485 [Bacteroidota bacterium]
MKKIIVSLILISVSVLSFLLVTTAVFAQPGPPATPIDGGLSLLLIAGGAYGAKKLNDHRRASK